MRLFLALLFFISVGAQALPKVTIEKINGFEVHFVDIGVGNSLGVFFQVPYGTLHDYGRFLGRAHLLEHLMHVGTVNYPGYHTFDKLLLPAGIESNASTYYYRTNYFAGAKEDQAELMIKVFLSMLGGLEFNPEAVEHERNVVINEIVEEGIPQQTDAFMQMPFTQLLPPDHPWNNALLGDRTSLQSLTKKDLQDLYDQIYRPGIVKIAIHGNFSKPGWLEQVRGWMRQYVKASPRQNGKRLQESTLATREIPSLFSETSMAPESQKRLYVHTEDFEMGNIILEADVSKFPDNSQAMDMLMQHFGSELPGTFLHKLKTELGWITEGSFSSYKVRGKQLLFFSYTMSAMGQGRGTEINEHFFRALKAAQDNDVSPDFLNREKKDILDHMERASRTVPSFMKLYGSALNEKKTFAQQIEDVKNLTPRDLRSVALLFRPDQALYEFSGPAKAEMQFDPVYNRKFTIEDNRRDLERYMKVMREPTQVHFDPRIHTVDLGELAPPSDPLFLQSKPGSVMSERFAIDLRQNLPDTAISLDFYLRPQSPRDMIALDLVMNAFNERYLAELSYLTSHYQVSLGTGRTAQSFTITASGENSYAARALAWQTNQLADFAPTADELARARERYSHERVFEYVTAFSGQIVTGQGKSLIDPFESGGIQNGELAKTITWEEMNDAWGRLRSHANRHLTAAGPINIEDLAEVRAAGFRFTKDALDPHEVARFKQRFTWSAEINEITRPFPKSKGDDAYGMVRYYKGPVLTDQKAAAAFQTLAALMGNLIYIHNRGEQELGYIHHAALRVMDGNSQYLILYGGTKGDENAAKTIAGWNTILERLRTGEVTDDEITDAISSVSNGLARMKTSARELVAQYSGELSLHGHARANLLTLEAARTLTPQYVREIAQKYLLADGTPYTQLTLHGCEELLSP